MSYASYEIDKLEARVKELEAQLAHAHAENLAFNVKVAEEINEARRATALAESAAAGAWGVVEHCRNLLGLKFGDDVREAIKNLNAQVATLRAQRDDAQVELADAKAVADPDNETPELTLRERIMHIGEQAALLVSANALCEKRGAELDEWKRLVARMRPVYLAAKELRDTLLTSVEVDSNLVRTRWYMAACKLNGAVDKARSREGADE